ncbi:MAG: hypothetical protein H3C43_02935, partial [Leptonema sp. (in: Bacteria)]|nr:hypothetical protein [Leptonema sp. (in: bacteria)]
RNTTLADFKLNQWFTLPKSVKRSILNEYADSLRIVLEPQLNAKSVRKIVYRSYRKACFLIKVFQNQPISKFLIQFNRSVNGKLNGAANAVYGNQPVLIPFESLPATPHPVTGKKLNGGNVSNMIERSIQRGIGFVNAAFLYSQNQLTISGLRKQLRPYSLNNGLERVATDEMKYSNIQSWPINPT